MNPRLAWAMFVLFELLSVVIGIVLIDNAITLLSDVRAGREPIDFDSSTHGCALMLICPWGHLCGVLQSRGRITPMAASRLVIGFFVALAVVAWGSALWLRVRVEGAGYQECPGPPQHRVAPGWHYVYARSAAECPRLE